jgi:2,4-dienoyl-CoA reductase-like NADH-dependent reductase (Old Yellow Enzyme family)
MNQGSAETMDATHVLGQAGLIGDIRLPNRLIRSGTSESMGSSTGVVDGRFEALHADLARGGVGLQFTGHLFVEGRGRYDPVQGGIHTDETVGPLQKATEAVHRAGGRIFAQLGHAGSQSVIPDEQPLSPSDVTNVMHGRSVQAASGSEIEKTLTCYHEAARRTARAGFDGIHIHAANGYLISQFRSPLTNLRDDEWGGDAERRERFPIEVIRAIRAAIPSNMPITMKVGVRDITSHPLALTREQSVAGIRKLIAAGLDGVEVSSNLMSDYVSGSIRLYVAVDRKRAFADLLYHRLLYAHGEDEAYFLEDAKALRPHTELPIILVGGLRRADTMAGIIESGVADFISMARPFIRQPDLARCLLSGQQEIADCVSCNICLKYDGKDGLRCWRTPRSRLLQHAVRRVAAAFRH